jgi:membrane-bound metal-dependent hydrolase YbcI (DUF457 family)
MDPVTHLLASYTVARAARARLASSEMVAFLLAGIVPDVDWLWYLPEPLSPLRAYGTAGHSLVGAAVLSAAVGCGVWAEARKRRPQAPALLWLLAAALVSAGLHLLLDLASVGGIELYWPFRPARISWNLMSSFDAILLAILTGCALFAAVFGLVTEEIGQQKDPRPARGWAVTALALMVLYFGARAVLHARAEQLLGEAQFHGASPRHWAAFPSGSSPFSWRGVGETDSFLAEIEIGVGTGRPLSAETASLHYKPEASPLVDAAAAAPLARSYTILARFPLLSLESTPEGTRAEIREFGDSALRTPRGAWKTVIDLDANSKVAHQELRYEPARAP